jgi:uncharacterized protein YegL
MMPTSYRRLLLVVPVLAVVTSIMLLGTVSATSPRQGGAAFPKPECKTGLTKSAVPSTLYVGDETMVTAVMTGTCPAYNLPIDLVLVVDKSNSMTRGNPGGIGPGPQPTSGGPGVNPFPTSGLPGPLPTGNPIPKPTAFLAPQAALQRVRGLAQINPPPIGPRPTIGAGTQVPGPIAHPSPTSLGNSLVPPAQVEAAGTEDLIRAEQEAIDDFIKNIQDDVKAGKIRLALVAFDDRAHVLVSLTDDAQRVRSALLHIKGGGNTRLDLGVQAGQRELVGSDVRGRTDLDHRKLMVIFSDGQADPRTITRLHTRDNVDVITVAAGRNANKATLRKVASDPQYALLLADRQGLVDLVNRIGPTKRQITIPALDVIEQLAPNMELVAGSANPVPASMPDAHTMLWHLEPPTLPVTFTYRVRPMESGKLKLSTASKATWADSELRKYDRAFPVIELDVLKPGMP